MVKPLEINFKIILFVIVLSAVIRLFQIELLSEFSEKVNTIYFITYKTIIIAFLLLYVKKPIISIQRKVVYFCVCLFYLYIIYYITITHYSDKEMNVFVYHFFECITVATFEETFLRYLIFKLVLDYYNKQQTKDNYLFKSIILTSFIFGILHFSNFIMGNYDILSTILQIEFAFLLGILFQHLYLKYKTLVVPIILHCTINYFGTINNLFEERSLEQDVEYSPSNIEGFYINQLFIIIILLIILLSRNKLNRNWTLKYSEFKYFINIK